MTSFNSVFHVKKGQVRQKGRPGGAAALCSMAWVNLFFSFFYYTHTYTERHTNAVIGSNCFPVVRYFQQPKAGLNSLQSQLQSPISPPRERFSRIKKIASNHSLSTLATHSWPCAKPLHTSREKRWEIGTHSYLHPQTPSILLFCQFSYPSLFIPPVIPVVKIK